MTISLQFIFKSIHYVINRFILRKKYLTAYAEKFNLYIKFKTEDGGGRHIYKRSTYENDISDFLANHLAFENGDVVFDIGANIGWYSLLLNKFYPQIRIFSFEPDPVNIECLQYNKNKNKASQVSIVEKAVSEKNGKQQFYLYKNSNKGRNSLLPINDYDAIEVDVIKLDDFVKENQTGHVRMIKMDIEGYEYLALKGATDVLSKVEVLLMEFSPNYMRKGSINPDDLIEMLKICKFSVFVLKDNKLHQVSYNWLSNRPKNTNVFLLKPTQTIISKQFLVLHNKRDN